MAWFGVGNGSPRGKTGTRAAVRASRRKAWNRLIDYLIKLPPLPSDD
jgi:hypothetical protein